MIKTKFMITGSTAPGYKAINLPLSWPSGEYLVFAANRLTETPH